MVADATFLNLVNQLSLRNLLVLFVTEGVIGRTLIGSLMRSLIEALNGPLIMSLIES